MLMLETLAGLALALGILIAAGGITHLFAKHMYNRCPRCRQLNARRRTRCRICDCPLE